MARSFDPVQLGSIELFCKAADLGSFSAAAEALGLTPAAVSRSVGRLEARLGARLFVRTTRSLRLTEDGALYRDQCRQALEQIAEAERAIGGRQQVPAGPLRLSVGTVYAHHRLFALLPAFSQQFPQIELDVQVCGQNVDFVEDGVDLAIRLGEPPNSRLIARKLEDAALGLYAAPAYLARHGTPTTREALAQHALLQFILPSTGRPMPWRLRTTTGADEDWRFASPWRVHDDVLGCVHWARAGGGVVQTYRFVAEPLLGRGELVEILPELGGATRPFYVLYPQNRHLSARVRALVEFLVRQVPTSPIV